MVITLIGYRGTGKSTVARPLAERLGWGWADADEAITARAGKAIRQIFSDDGEECFRQHEREVLRLQLERSKLVIAAGGGAILNEQTRQEMRDAGPVVWLTASVETIVARLEGDPATSVNRPSLTAAGGRREVERLLAVREPLYRECADVIIDTDQRDVQAIVDEILREIGPRLQEGDAG